MSLDKRKFMNGMSATDGEDASKKLDIQVNPSQTPKTTTTLESNGSENITVTLPNATDTLVGKATTDVLTNKTIDANNNTINVSADGIVATELNDALAELQDNIDLKADQSALEAHIDDTTGAHAASAISNTPSGNLAATDVQGALNELQTEVDTKADSSALQAHIDDTTDAHDASAISSVPSGNLAASDVQAALDELQSDIDTRAPINNPSFTGTTFDAVSSTATNISTSNTISSVNIGTGSGANTITIGSANSTVNILGNVLHETATNVDIKDALITLNKGGGASSGSAAGIEIEEGGSITAYVETSGDRNSWVVKAPNATGVVSLTPGSTDDTVTLNAASQTLTNKTLGDALTIDGQPSKPSNPSAGFYKTYIKDSDGKLAILDSSGNETIIGGGATTYTVVAGENLNANDAIYIANASDSGRTLGRAYKLDPTNANRIEFAGFITANANTGASGTVNTAGQLSGFTGLTVGEPVFASVTVPGSYQVTVPSVVGQYIIQLGVADSANSLLINGALSATATLVESPNANIGAATGTSLVLGGVLDSSAILQADSTAKGFLAPRMTQAQRDAISTPATGLQIYNTSTNKLNIYNGTSWTEAGSSSSSGGKNYIPNPDFEAGATNNWALGTVTLDATTKFPSGSPTFGSGASANLSITTVTSGNQLAGTYSLSYVSAAATTAGNFVASDAFTIDKEHQAKALKFSFSYQAAVNPNNANWSGTTANSFGVAIYDVTNSQWIQPSGCFSMIQSGGVGQAFGEFQTSATGTQYRLVVYNANATSGAITLYMDSFTWGPQQISMGPPVTDWVSYTPTWTVASGTNPAIGNGTISGRKRRVGDSQEIEIIIVSGTTTTYGSGTYLFGLPPTEPADTANTSGLGSVSMYRNSSPFNSYVGFIGLYSATQLLASGTGVSNWTNTAPTTLDASTSGHTIRITMKYKVSGWSSNTVMSSDAAVNVVAMSAHNSITQQTNIAPNGSWVQMQFSNIVKDTNSKWNGTNTYTIPISGQYLVTGIVNIAAANVLASRYLVNIYKNGSLSAPNSGQITPTAGTNFGLPFSQILDCNAGDTISVYLYGAGNNSVNKLSSDGGQINILRISGPAQIAASDTVALDVRGMAAQSLTGSFTTNTIIYTAKTTDTHGGYNTSTGEYTVPVSGYYNISAQIGITAGAQTINSEFNLCIFVDGSQVISGLYFSPSTGTYSIAPLSVTTQALKLNAGQKVKIAETHSSATTYTSYTGNSYSYFTLSKRGL